MGLRQGYGHMEISVNTSFWIDRYGEFNGKVSDKIYERGFIVPTHPSIDLEDIDYISEVCNA